MIIHRSIPTDVSLTPRAGSGRSRSGLLALVVATGRRRRSFREVVYRGVRGMTLELGVILAVGGIPVMIPITTDNVRAMRTKREFLVGGVRVGQVVLLLRGARDDGV